MSKTTLLLWILTSALAFSQSSTLSPAAASSSVNLPAHETLHYTVEWRLITAGKARLELMPVAAPKPGYQVGLHLESSGLVSKLFKVEDDYLSNLNQNFCAQSLQLTSHEGNRQRETKVTFDTEAKRAAYLERDKVKNSTVLQQEIDIPPCVHDVIGGIYQMRTLNLEPGQATEIPVSDGKKVVMARIEAQQHEDVKTPAGTFKTTRYEIYLFNGVLYKRQAHMYVWLTDDRRKLPIQLRVRLQFTIGTITFLLSKQEN
jgi:hypothetical protein